MDFDFQPTLQGRTITIRPLVPDDFPGLFSAASDPLIWAGHPAKNRHEAAVFRPYFDALLASRSSVAVTVRKSGRTIGCSRYYIAPTPTQDLSIGFTFLSRSHWGGDTNHELKALMLGHLFKTRDEAWFHIAPDNLRSQRATSKLGAVLIRQETLDLGMGPTLWLSFRITAQDWAKTVASRAPHEG